MLTTSLPEKHCLLPSAIPPFIPLTSNLFLVIFQKNPNELRSKSNLLRSLDLLSTGRRPFFSGSDIVNIHYGTIELCAPYDMHLPPLIIESCLVTTIWLSLISTNYFTMFNDIIWLSLISINCLAMFREYHLTFIYLYYHCVGEANLLLASSNPIHPTDHILPP